ncbi:pyridine nucleotide-disulfide oxidoreductase [Rhodococcoides fascians]|uniref:ArsO family NAD(P)H-dependent flavin-containing monooxygenase n=1 Tax=Rhodococcoides fascians TaxID=1828 RepID=UPI000B9C16B1|nr:ArsO family NAD(P)H-dependent flavin-containing monooxygenase [Rhodococcus fascians]OZE91123.1 pyridine nucleotide-disulfide oxidoreductase [Rhodococcus fascians]OZF20809.1 pyridine nucleotide-disulfide oxidoreductase [Rhodococcus fascians]OZF23810.1 pyridine nucleotide-disulfide oxidoreductase [Rhodococcus fascians]OZF69928.1 pyridine nucleotide-disulfide oxidoreductase [Rhodococcus fascians]OZF72258.1 pyridine nucleotide-disulfide oxidoreductase [Rhodococcus fascians]
MNTEVVVIGGGQAGLSAGYYLRRAGLDFVILDNQTHAGGSWQDYWPSLHLFSPAEYSRLPGWPMPAWHSGFPPASHVVDYLRAYEKKYDLPVHRPVDVKSVHRTTEGYRVDTDGESYGAAAVVNATGTWSRPFWPSYPGMREFGRTQLHAADYRTPDMFAGKRVGIVGGGNSAAQILAEISTVAQTLWFTNREPRFLPDDVDGRVLFDVASDRSRTLAAGGPDPGGVAGLGDIVMVPPVREARDRGVLHARPMFTAITTDGVTDGHTTEKLDVILWCTGFRPALRHLQPLHLHTEGSRIVLDGNHVRGEPTLVFLGYGDWTGPASATLIGVGRTARAAVDTLVRRGKVDQT